MRKTPSHSRKCGHGGSFPADLRSIPTQRFAMHGQNYRWLHIKKCSIWFPMLIDSFYLFSNPPQRTAPQNWYVHFRAGKWCCCMAPLRTWIATATSNLANNGATFLVPQKHDEKISSPLLRWNSAEQHLMLITNPVKKENTQCWIVSFSVAWK